jgi:hypothetical protein
MTLVEANLSIGVFKSEVENASRGKEKVKLNEKLKSNKLKVKGPQIDKSSRSKLEFKSVEAEI